MIVAGKDQGEADNDYLLIPVNILDHEGGLSSGFPVENRLLPQGALRGMKNLLHQIWHLQTVVCRTHPCPCVL